MASIKIINGYLYLSYFDQEKGYSRPKTLHTKATQESIRQAKRDLKLGKIKIPGSSTRVNLRDVPSSLTLTDVLPSYFIYKNLAPRTREIYEKAVDHLIQAAGTKFIYDYTKSDYIKLIKYFEKLPVHVTVTINKITKEKENKILRTGLEQNTQSIYTRTLHALFTYLVKEHLVKENFIGRIPELSRVPRPIDIADMEKILNKIRHNKDQYNIIYFLYNTGIRISTALALTWKDIDWQQNRIIFRNVKVGGKEYTFPITDQLKEVLTSIGIKTYGKVFSYENKDSLKFFTKAQTDLNLTNHYGIHKLKATFISDMVNEGISLKVLSEITNTSIRTLEKHYTKLDQKRIAAQLNNIKRL